MRSGTFFPLRAGCSRPRLLFLDEWPVGGLCIDLSKMPSRSGVLFPRFDQMHMKAIGKTDVWLKKLLYLISSELIYLSPDRQLPD